MQVIRGKNMRNIISTEDYLSLMVKQRTANTTNSDEKRFNLKTPKV